MAVKKVPGWLSALLVGGTFCALVWMERRRPLRRREVEPKGRRNARNLAVAGLSAAAIQIAEKPVTGPRAALVERRRWGSRTVPNTIVAEGCFSRYSKASW